MWSLVLVWLIGSNVTSQVVSGFESKAACENGYNVLSSRVNWGSGSKLIGQCVSMKETPAEK